MSSTYSAEFETFWESRLRRSGPDPKAPAYKSWQKWMKQGVKPEEISKGMAAFSKAYADKKGTQFVTQTVTWLNQRRWEDDYTPVEQAKTVRFGHSSDPSYFCLRCRNTGMEPTISEESDFHAVRMTPCVNPRCHYYSEDRVRKHDSTHLFTYDQFSAMDKAEPEFTYQGQTFQVGPAAWDTPWEVCRQLNRPEPSFIAELEEDPYADIEI